MISTEPALLIVSFDYPCVSFDSFANLDTCTNQMVRALPSLVVMPTGAPAEVFQGNGSLLSQPLQIQA